MTTVESVDNLLAQGRFNTIKECCEYIYKQCKIAKANTGFKTGSLEKFYNQVKNFKSRISKDGNSQEEI